MDITFKQRELKKDSLEFNEISYCYLLAIKETNPTIWATLKHIINKVDNEK